MARIDTRRKRPRQCTHSRKTPGRMPGPQGARKGPVRYAHKMAEPLDDYRAKRDFSATPEPSPGDGQGARGPAGVRGPPARRARPALRPAARDGGCAQVLGRAEGVLVRPDGEAPGGAHRGPPDRVRALRRRHPRGPVRRGHDDDLGPRHVRGAQGALAGRARARRAQAAPVRAQAARRVAHGPDQGREGQGVALVQEPRPLLRRRPRLRPGRSTSPQAKQRAHAEERAPDRGEREECEGLLRPGMAVRDRAGGQACLVREARDDRAAARHCWSTAALGSSARWAPCARRTP